MQALRFDFDAPAVEAPPPFRGRTKAARHAGWTGARQAVRTLGQKVSAYLQLLNQAGALTDQEAAVLLKCGVSSINSIRNSIIDRAHRRRDDDPIVPDGFDAQTWPDGGVTRRTRWKLATHSKGAA